MYTRLKSIRRYRKSIFAIAIVIFTIFLLTSHFAKDPWGLRTSPEFSREAARAQHAHFVIASASDGEERLDHAQFNYVVSRAHDVCSTGRHLEKGKSLLILVSSATGHSDRRLAIRRTWADRSHATTSRVTVRFLLGLPPGAMAQQQSSIEKENETFGDIVQGSFIDSYNNLSIKSVMGLHFAHSFCHGVDYVMKTDDDVFVNVHLLTNFLGISGERRWIGGCIKQRRAPVPYDVRGARVPMVIGHPPFVAGAGYVMSSDIVEELYDASTKRAIIPVEDAYVTAYCARMVGVAPTHYDAFNCGEPVFDDCQMKDRFVGHHVTPDRQRQLWEIVNDPTGEVCKMLRD